MTKEDEMEPYRCRDAGDAEAEGWRWIEALAAEEAGEDPAALRIESPPLGSDGRAITLYRGTKLLALATIFRDQMNFAVLVRWRATLTTPRLSPSGELVERALRAAAERFREYESHHRDKAERLGDTIEREELDRKAERNRDMAQMCEAALTSTGSNSLSLGVTDAMIDAALHARVPGGAEVWHWLPQKDAFTPLPVAREVIKCAIAAALSGQSGEALEHGSAS